MSIRPKSNRCAMVRLLLVVMLLILIVSFTGCQGIADYPKAKGGVIDLTSLDFSSGDIAKLDGQWELYEGMLIFPEDFHVENNLEHDYFVIPNLYSESLNGKELPKIGYGTLRLIVKLPDEGVETYGIISRQILSASKIWINGSLISESGVVGMDDNTARSSFERQLAFFNVRKNIENSEYKSNEVEIVIQTSNFHNIRGKIRNILLGYGRFIKREYVSTVAMDNIIIGALVVMGIYHVALYFKRPKNKAPLYFAVFCMFAALRNILVGGRLIYEIWPNIPFYLLNKLAYLTVYAAFPFIVMFFNELFKDELSSKAVNMMNVVSFLISVVTVFTNIQVYNSFLKFYEVWILIFFAYLIYVIVKAIRNKVQGSRVILFGILVFVAASINDMLLQEGILHTRSLAAIGFFVFIFSQSYILAAQFSDAFLNVERLLEENKAIYRDALTGILNRRGFYDQVETMKLENHEHEGFALIYGDLNDFKRINDSHGHSEGDEALKMAAKIISEEFNDSDIVARMSGDEFIALAMGKTTKKEIQIILRNLKNAFERNNRKSNKPYNLSISLGYSICEKYMSITLDELIYEADMMLYRNKGINKKDRI